MLRQVGGLTDVYLATHPSVSELAVTLSVAQGESSRTLPDPSRGIAELGITCDSPLNTWTAGKTLDPRAQRGAGKRLDYIYYSAPRVAGDVYSRLSSPSQRRHLGQLVPISCDVTFTDPIPLHNLSYTDHFGVEAIFALTPACSTATASGTTTTAQDEAAVVETSTDPRTDAAEGRMARAIECLNASIAALVRGLQQAETNQRFWLAGFVTTLLVAIGLCIGSGFQPQRGVGAIFTFFAVVAGFGGTTMLYTGLIWGEWEKRTSLPPYFNWVDWAFYANADISFCFSLSFSLFSPGIYRRMLESMREELRCLHRGSPVGSEPATVDQTLHSYHDSSSSEDNNSTGSGTTDEGGFALQTINPNHLPATTATVTTSSGDSMTRVRPSLLVAGPLQEEEQSA